MQINYKEKLLQALKGSFQHFQEMQEKYQELQDEVRRSEEEKMVLEERIRASMSSPKVPALANVSTPPFCRVQSTLPADVPCFSVTPVSCRPCVYFQATAAATPARDVARVTALQDSIKKLRDKLADQQRMMKLAEAQVDKVKRLETEITKIKEAKVTVDGTALCVVVACHLIVVVFRACVCVPCGQVRLIRQQKEAANRHRELMDMKTREIAALKKHQVTQQKTVASLQVESKRQAAVLDRRHRLLEVTQRQLKTTQAQLLEFMMSQRRREASMNKSVFPVDVSCCCSQSDAISFTHASSPQ